MKQNSMFVKWVSYILGSITFLLGLIMWWGSVTEKMPIDIAIGMMLSSFLALHLGYSQKSKKQRKKELEAAIHGKKVNKKKPANYLYVSHLQGLPLSRFLRCTIIFEPDRFVICGGGNDFVLEFDKITGMSVSTDEQLQDQYVSDAGGAVAGGLAAGSVGAALGGGARSYTARNYNYYLIFTYMRNGAFANITFKVNDDAVEKARDFSRLYNEQYIRNNGYEVTL